MRFVTSTTDLSKRSAPGRAVLAHRVHVFSTHDRYVHLVWALKKLGLAYTFVPIRIILLGSITLLLYINYYLYCVHPVPNSYYLGTSPSKIVSRPEVCGLEL